VPAADEYIAESIAIPAHRTPSCMYEHSQIHLSPNSSRYTIDFGSVRRPRPMWCASGPVPWLARQISRTSWYDTTPTQPPTRTFSLYCHPSNPLRGNINSACVAFLILGPHMVVVLPRRKHQRPILVPKPRGRSHLLKRIAPRQKEALLSTDGRVPQQFDPITPIVLAL
jgi:hypothetical protein